MRQARPAGGRPVVADDVAAAGRGQRRAGAGHRGIGRRPLPAVARTVVGAARGARRAAQRVAGPGRGPRSGRAARRGPRDPAQGARYGSGAGQAGRGAGPSGPGPDRRGGRPGLCPRRGRCRGGAGSGAGGPGAGHALGAARRAGDLCRRRRRGVGGFGHLDRHLARCGQPPLCHAQPRRAPRGLCPAGAASAHHPSLLPSGRDCRRG